ncbi:MAG: sulfite exporter TauE/SafE family protein [Candidatus Ornithospirochaeta sp.]
MLMFIFALVVFVATVVGSISGIGGGVLIKPVMDAAFSMPTSEISFLSGTTVLTMTVVSLYKSRKELKIDLRTVMLALGGAIGGVLGKQIFDIVKKAAGNDAFVGLVQNVIMVLLTLSVFIYTMKKASIRTKDFKNPVFSLSVGLLLGILSSFLGIGGGPINIMVLSYLFSLDTKSSALSSLFIIFFSQVFSLFSSLATRTIPAFQWPMLIMMMICAVVGSTTGRMFSRRMDNKAVDKLFMALMAVIIALSIYNSLKFGFML